MGESCGGSGSYQATGWGLLWAAACLDLRPLWYQATGGGLFGAAACLELRPLGSDSVGRPGRGEKW